MEAGAIRAGAHAHGAGHDEHEHHGPPPANRSSRVDPAMLGMLLFIISEIMVFGAFFTAYFFIRVVQGAEWPAEGDHLPKVIAGVNTAILISSSFTLHWAEHAHKMGNRRGLQVGMLTTFLLGATFLFVQINEYVHVGFSLLLFVTIRAFRGHFTKTEHRGIEVPGIYWHFVDLMWIVVYVTVYIL